MGKTSPLATLALAILFLALSGTNPAMAGQQTGCCQCDQCASGLVECMDVTGGQPQCDVFCASQDCALAAFTPDNPCSDITPCEEIVGKTAIMAPTVSWPLIVGLSIFLAGLGVVYVRRRSAVHASTPQPEP